jgi:hypothetical protein
MCINNSIILMLRAFINDLDENDYTDDRLSQLISVAAMYVNQEIGGSYVINIATPSITPDPIEAQDYGYTNLVVMKTACLVDQGNFRLKAALAGLEAKLGPATLKTAGHLDGYKELLSSGPCGIYRSMLLDYTMGTGRLGHAILSPFISNTFDPQNLKGYYDGGRS